MKTLTYAKQTPIKHETITEVDEICKYYSEKDGVPIRYVCTTDFDSSHDDPADIFYRDTPHPEFGNKYFALRVRFAKVIIYNADAVDGLVFGLVEDDDGNLQYSHYHHDFKLFDNGNMIDGGRSYIKSNCRVHVYQVKNGDMVPLTEALKRK